MKQTRSLSRVRRGFRQKRKRFERPSWLWHWHHLLSGFVLFFGVGMMLASVQYSAVKFPARAATPGNVLGWLWADPIGWTSVNSANAGACSPGPCGSYGVNVDPATRNMNGFAWNDDAGWICFGDSCSIGACNASAPGAFDAHINPVAGVTDVHGWANVCNETGAGWISIHCSDAGASCAGYSYKVVYDPSTKKFTPTPSSLMGSIGWNGNTLGTGFGYMDFSRVYLNTLPENDPSYGASACRDGSDNDLNGLKDCADPACQGIPGVCDEKPGTIDSSGNDECHNGVDDNGGGAIDCADANCKTSPFCAEAVGLVNATAPGYPLSGIPLCADGIDDNLNGSIDCADPGCSGYIGPPGASCGVTPPAGTEAACGLPPFSETVGGPPPIPKTAQQCCTDGINNDAGSGNTQTDCDDSSCQAAVPQCVPAWLQTKFGNIYAQSGLSASSSPLITGQSATYCLSTQGAISGFSSQSGCTETGTQAQNISLPTASQNYQGTLGKLDIKGILAGRYGAVVPLPGSIVAGGPALLSGAVFHVIGNATLDMAGFPFQNGVASTDHGNGLLFIDGGDLTITGNMSYAPLAGLTALRNLASFGVIVTKSAGGTGGNIIIDPSVTNLVGAYFAEDTISTGTKCPGVSTCPADVPLNVAGLFAAHKINLQRNYRDPNRAAEVVTFDGRPVANPPPGMADVAKSLPTSKDTY